MSPAAILLKRLLAWLSRNPSARADALELAATAARTRADDREREGRLDAARRLRGTAKTLETRAQQLRPAIGPVRNTVPLPPPPKRGQG